jgi:hypothetical protein
MAALAKVVVNFKCYHVFNGVFEMQKSTRNSKKIAKMRVFGTSDPRIYHTGINHGAALRKIYSSLTRGCGSNAPLVSPRGED